MDNHDLPKVELTNLEAYQNVASDFSRTRYKIWPSTRRYLESIDKIGSDSDTTQRVLEVGCGNGKNFTEEFDRIQFEGTDICSNLLQICMDRGYSVKLSDGCNLPYEDSSFDHVFSVAVIHHLSTPERRHMFIEEMIRVCKPGGRIMFQVWATTSPQFEKSIEVEETTDPNDRYVLFKIEWGNGALDESNRRFYHFFDENDFADVVSQHPIKGDIYCEANNHIFEGIVEK